MSMLRVQKVISNTEIAPNAYLLKFARDFDFYAGQVIGISLDPGQEPRLYSIASGVDMPEVWILYTINPEGLLTPQLQHLGPGDELYITEVFGNFLCREQEAVWIATGTGIAPFASMLFSGQGEGKILIQGNREQSGLYLREYFEDSMPERYFGCCSRRRADTCFHGRVTDFVQQWEGLKTNIPYYLCGSAEMVVDVRDLLIERGVPFENIMAEIFF